MSMKRTTKRAPRILIFGEDVTDTAFLKELVVGLCPDLADKIIPRISPPILIRDAPQHKVPSRVDVVAAVVAAESVDREIICIFAHEDCDDVEPAHVGLSKKIEQAFAAKGLHVHAVNPAWETEAWLFLWPDAVVAYRPSWCRPDAYIGKNVGLMKDAKEVFRRAVRPAGPKRVRDYRETDAPKIAEIVRSKGLARNPNAQSKSFDSFVLKVDSCCASLMA